MTGTIFLGGTARRKSSGARSQLAGACRTNTQAVLRLAWGGLARAPLGPRPPEQLGPDRAEKFLGKGPLFVFLGWRKEKGFHPFRY